MHFRQRAIEQEGARVQEQSKGDRCTLSTRAALCVDGVGAILGTDFTGVRKTPQAPAAPPRNLALRTSFIPRAELYKSSQSHLLACSIPELVPPVKVPRLTAVCHFLPCCALLSP